jgi:uncharacterized membrane protein
MENPYFISVYPFVTSWVSKLILYRFIKHRACITWRLNSWTSFRFLMEMDVCFQHVIAKQSVSSVLQISLMCSYILYTTVIL